MNEKDLLAALTRRFEKQTEFAADYSPLYKRLFQIMWERCVAVTEPQADPLIAWLLHVAAGRRPFDVPLLLLAGVHYQVLAYHPATAELRPYYASVGGNRSAADTRLADIFVAAILALRDQIGPFVETGLVQTNETGRGLSWVLPLSLLSQFPPFTLVDLGASAGLNLVADYRSFTIVEKEQERLIGILGEGKPPQFRTESAGEIAALDQLENRSLSVANRLGLDLRPHPIQTEEDERRLLSYVWADQSQRFVRLQEGLTAQRQALADGHQIELYQVELPEDLNRFLVGQEWPDQPVVLYNTYITQYFAEKAYRLREIISEWAQTHTRPVLWIQWEPRDDWTTGVRASDLGEVYFGWCAWTIDLWHEREHKHWRLGWVHPHGIAAHFEDGLTEWSSISGKIN